MPDTQTTSSITTTETATATETASAVDLQLSSIKRHAYLAAYGTDVLAPLAEPPKIAGDVSLFDSLIYENGGREAIASLLTRNGATITLKTKNIGKALSLLSSFTTGSDTMAAANAKALSFTPISAAAEKVLTFPRAYLKPELSYAPGMGSDHTATLVFEALPDSTTGKLYTFA